MPAKKRQATRRQKTPEPHTDGKSEPRRVPTSSSSTSYVPDKNTQELPAEISMSPYSHDICSQEETALFHHSAFHWNESQMPAYHTYGHRPLSSEVIYASQQSSPPYYATPGPEDTSGVEYDLSFQSAISSPMSHFSSLGNIDGMTPGQTAEETSSKIGDAGPSRLLASPDIDVDVQDLGERKKLKNREAATKARAKRKNRIAELEQKLAATEQELKDKDCEIANLRGQIEVLERPKRRA